MIQWQYTKGAYNKQYNGTGSAVLYTFIDYYGGMAMPTTLNENMLPTIEICDNTNRSASGAIKKSAGHIVTSGIDQTFEQGVKISRILTVNTIHDHEDHSYINVSDGELSIGYNSTNIHFFGADDSPVINFSIENPNDCSARFGMNVNVDGDITATKKISGADIYSTNLCQAKYFNATSDRRAKTDIKPINQSVLPLVTNTQLYSFKYKDLDTPSIGIIAQDVQDVDFDGFSLVDNKEATGQDMDYMSIHESKLIYVLWKAVQEQQKEIEELKAQIKKGL